MIWIKALLSYAWWSSAVQAWSAKMPPEAVIVVTAVLGAFSLLMGTLAWVMWYTRATPRPVPRD